jgi:hypothetical protein
MEGVLYFSNGFLVVKIEEVKVQVAAAFKDSGPSSRWGGGGVDRGGFALKSLSQIRCMSPTRTKGFIFLFPLYMSILEIRQSRDWLSKDKFILVGISRCELAKIKGDISGAHREFVHI